MIGSGSVRLDLDALRDHMCESWEAASLPARSRAALELKDSKVCEQFVLRATAEILEAIGCPTVLIGGGTTSPLRGRSPRPPAPVWLPSKSSIVPRTIADRTASALGGVAGRVIEAEAAAPQAPTRVSLDELPRARPHEH